MLNFETIYPKLPYLLGGTVVTLQYTVASLFFGFILGTFLALLKVSKFKVLSTFATGYTSVFRGTPVLLQLTAIYHGVPPLGGFEIGIFEAGVIAFSLNSGAYTSEVIRAGIKSVDRGQFEALSALGISYSKGMKDIIMPQAIRIILPALVNEMVNLLKESSLVSVIGAEDLMRRCTKVSVESTLFFEPLIVIGCIYYVLVMIFSTLAKFLEKRLAIYD